MSKQRLLPLFLAFICFLVMSFGMIMPVHAAKYECEACGVEHQVDGVKAAVLKIADTAGSINFFQKDPGSGLGLTELLKFDVNGNDIFRSLWYGSGNKISVQAMSQAVTPIAVLLAVVYFLLELSERVLSEQFSTDQMIVALIRLGVVILIVTNAFYFLTIITEFCTEVYKLLQNATGAITPSAGRCYLSSINELNIAEIVAYMLSLMFTYLFMLGARILILVTAWKRIFELVIYSMFFPIGIADTVRGGLQSSGVRYIKKIASKFLQGAVCLAIMVGYNLTSSLALTAGTAAGGVGAMIVALTVMTLMMQSGNISSTIVGG